MADRVMTIGIRNYLLSQPRTKRARKAVKFIRNRVAHYTKLEEENVKISQSLNNLIFKYYSRRMVPVKLTVKVGTDTADVLPFEEKKAQTTEARPQKKGILSRIVPKVEKLPSKVAQPTQPTSVPSQPKAQPKPQKGQKPEQQPAPASQK